MQPKAQAKAVPHAFNQEDTKVSIKPKFINVIIKLIIKLINNAIKKAKTILSYFLLIIFVTINLFKLFHFSYLR